METAIRWSPTSTTSQQRFLYVDIAGKALKLCEVHEDCKRPVISYDVVSQHQRLSPFLAFDWWPYQESLVAIGLASGEAVVYRMEDEGASSIVFPVRSQRYCNAVAFSSHGLLASGLDKVRIDFSLQVWDVNQKLASPDSQGYRAAEPLRKLASAEPVCSVKFFKDHPDTLVAGIKSGYVRIYDLRESNGNPSLQFSTKNIHNLAIDPLDENYIASCDPVNGGHISIWDRRAGAKFTPATMFSTDGQQKAAALDYENVTGPKSSIWGLRFSPTKRGTLAMLSDSGDFKVFELGKEYVSEEYLSSFDQTMGHDSANAYARPIYTRNTRSFPSPFSGTSQMDDDSQKVKAFDFLNLGTSNDAHAVTVLGNKNVALYSLPRPHRPMSISSQGPLAYGCHSQDDMSFKIIEPSISPHFKISAEIENIRERSRSQLLRESIPLSLTPLDEAKNPLVVTLPNLIPLSRREQREKLLSVGLPRGLPVEDVLTWLSIPKYRCQEGYLPSNPQNTEIIAEDAGLVELWNWINRARARSDGNSMVIHNIDMNYLGVFFIWNNRLGRSLGSRILTGLSNRSIDVSSLIQDLVEELALPEGKACFTENLAHRQLCLHVLGAVEYAEDLEKIMQELVDEHKQTKAAALALFQDETKLAYQALMKNQPTQAHKLLAMAIIGASRGQLDPDWEETCAEIARELTDPYSRAILALVSKGDWGSVIDEKTLPLKYRVEVALRWLPDDELTIWLRDITSESIIQGDVEGIVLTGLDHAAMDLFQCYIKKFHDVQTPVLAMSHTIPRFISDQENKTRFEAWRELYRRQVNSWKAHLSRVKFDVESRKLASTWDGRQLFKPPAQQISLVCNYCTKPLSQYDGTSGTETPTTASANRNNIAGGPAEGVHTTSTNPLGTSAATGTVCPKCGRHMPRCGVCSLWLGTVDPMAKSSIAEDEKKKQAESRESIDLKTPQPATAENVDELMKRFVVFCSNCNHGFHAHHARNWFSKHRICPVAECNCICDR
ncbi:ubiquitin-protein ligase E3 [Ascosphaera apis ARSEF 7405]|uniref:Ubiquitin-protein ligase E3 n=1 Tax=Ascosphaera apis ARSEF 7405 TaxID=392613 RepID=A0A167ZJD1_9EURO|nr:ubiquitin-protein ligase E3 [Ascosphaera apis ARSEF 7405]